MLPSMIESRMFTATVRPTSEGADGDSWAITVPDIGEISVDDVLEAEDAARALVCEHLAVETWQERQDIGIQLVDVTGAPLFAFPLIAWPVGRPKESTEYAALACRPAC